MFRHYMDLGLSFEQTEKFLLYLTILVDKDTSFLAEEHKELQALLKQVKDYGK